MKRSEIMPLRDEPACGHGQKAKSGCAKPRPAATQGECSSEGAQIALLPNRLGVSHLRIGYPLFEQIGAYARVWIGHRGCRHAIFDVANLLWSRRQTIAPYTSIYWRDASEHHKNGAAASSPGSIHEPRPAC
jgi:hypothetical protein